jgi:hypothetical protein
MISHYDLFSINSPEVYFTFQQYLDIDSHIPELMVMEEISRKKIHSHCQKGAGLEGRPLDVGVPDCSGHYRQIIPYFRDLLRENCTEKRSRKWHTKCPECPKYCGGVIHSQRENRSSHSVFGSSNGMIKIITFFYCDYVIIRIAPCKMPATDTH